MFRGQLYEFDKAINWFTRRPENGSGLGHKFSTAGLLWRHAFPGTATKATLAAFNYQAKAKGHDKAWINDGAILYKDLGEDFYTRRLRLGWEGPNGHDALYEIKEFAELLLSFWPHQVRFSTYKCIKLSDLVVSETGQVLCFDWKNAVVGEREVRRAIRKAFSIADSADDALFDAYKAYVYNCLQKSWEDFLAKHKSEVNSVQAFREHNYNADHFDTPDEVIVWEVPVNVTL